MAVVSTFGATISMMYKIDPRRHFLLALHSRSALPLVLNRFYQTDGSQQKIMKNDDDTVSGNNETSEEPKRFDELYGDAVKNINETQVIMQQMLKSVAKKMRISLLAPETLQCFFPEPLFPNKKSTELNSSAILRSSFKETMNELQSPNKDSPSPDELKYLVGYQVALDLEVPGKREVIGSSYEDFLTDKHLNELFKDSPQVQSKRLNNLLVKWRHKNKNKQKREEKLSLKEPEEIATVDENDHVTHNKLIRRINNSYMNKVENNILFRQQQFGTPLIVDMRFNDEKTNKVDIAAKQIALMHGNNRSSRDPFRLVFANIDDNNCKALQILHKDDIYKGLNDQMLDLSTKSYLDMEPMIVREDLIYLSPDGDDMDGFDPKKVYIIAALVDSTLQKLLTKTIARAEGIICQRFPLQKYLVWGGISGREALSLDIVLKIMTTLKETNNNWIEALRHVPVRFHRGLTEEGKQLANHDSEIIHEFERGNRWLVKSGYLDRQLNVNDITQSKAVRSYFGRT